MHKGPCMQSAATKCSHSKETLDQGRKLTLCMQRQHGCAKLGLHCYSCSETVQAVLQSTCWIIKAKQTHTRPVGTCHGSSPVKWRWISLPARHGHVPLFLRTALQLPPPQMGRLQMPAQPDQHWLLRPCQVSFVLTWIVAQKLLGLPTVQTAGPSACLCPDSYSPKLSHLRRKKL